MTDIINTSLVQGTVPIINGKLQMSSLYPNRQPPSIEKLRPISLTSTLAKIAEGRVAQHVLKSIQPHVDDRQYGNRKGMSTTHCLIDVYHQLVSKAEKPGNISTLVLTDFSKAFSSLFSMGVALNIVQWWLTSYLVESKESYINKPSLIA